MYKKVDSIIFEYGNNSTNQSYLTSSIGKNVKTFYSENLDTMRYMMRYYMIIEELHYSNTIILSPNNILFTSLI